MHLTVRASTILHITLPITYGCTALSGAFGSGAAFALEDAWTLGQAISHALSHDLPLAEALRLFDETRSPYYSKLFAELWRMGAAAEKGKHLPWDEQVADRIDERWGSHDWIYLHDVCVALADRAMHALTYSVVIGRRRVASYPRARGK